MVNLQINYTHHQQLSSFYVGLELLKNQKKIKLDLDFSQVKINKSPILFGRINSSTFCIDCLDGYNWIEGSLIDNLSHYGEKINADFIFKRNFNLELVLLKPNSKIVPFGFNYGMGFKKNRILSSYRYSFNNPFWALRYARLLSGYFDYRTFEASPEISMPLTFLYQVRLWDPASSKDFANSELRTKMNQFRIDCVRMLRKHFPKNSFAGVEDSNLARQLCPDLILSPEETSRKNYFQLIRKASIGIATNGLHNSIGWKIGEYLAASRAIITERPFFLFPPQFQEGKHYEAFSSSQELGTLLDRLLSNPKAVHAMMKENNHYYVTYQRPDRLVWNILSQVME